MPGKKACEVEIGTCFDVDTRDCIEKLILDKLRDYTLGAVREEMKKEDEELEQKMKDLQFLTQDNLDVSPVCKEHPETMQKVTEQLQRIQNVSSPAEKVGMRARYQNSWTALSSPAEHSEHYYRAEIRVETMPAPMISCLLLSMLC